MGTCTVKGEPVLRENAKNTKILDAIQLPTGTKKKERNLKKMSEDALRLLKMKFTRFFEDKNSIIDIKILFRDAPGFFSELGVNGERVLSMKFAKIGAIVIIAITKS